MYASLFIYIARIKIYVKLKSMYLLLSREICEPFLFKKLQNYTQKRQYCSFYFSIRYELLKFHTKSTKKITKKTYSVFIFQSSLCVGRVWRGVKHSAELRKKETPTLQIGLVCVFALLITRYIFLESLSHFCDTHLHFLSHFCDVLWHLSHFCDV